MALVGRVVGKTAGVLAEPRLTTLIQYLRFTGEVTGISGGYLSRAISRKCVVWKQEIERAAMIDHVTKIGRKQGSNNRNYNN
jgi:hypothetical protein